MIDELLSVDKSLNRESLFCLTRVDIEKNVSVINRSRWGS